MDCPWTEKISALVDKELDERETIEATEHAETCVVCQQALSDFLTLRREIKTYTAAETSEGTRRALGKIMGRERVPLWRKQVALPVPALALLLFALVALGVWGAFARLPSSRAPEEKSARDEKRAVPPKPAPGAPGEPDLARFDHGGRALVFKVRREPSREASQ